MAVDLVRADLQESLVPVFAGSLQQDVGSVDVRFYERARVEKGAINVGLRRKVDDGVHLAGQGVNCVWVAEITLDEAHARFVPGFRQVLLAPGIGELVQNGEIDVGIVAQPIADKGRADEPGTAGDEQPVETQPTHARRSWLGGSRADGTAQMGAPARPASLAGNLPPPFWGADSTGRRNTGFRRSGE